MRTEQQVIDRIRKVLAGADERRPKAQQIAELIRCTREYRWVGLYQVDGEEITTIAWSGPGEPAYPRFPASQGLCGAAVRSGAAVVVGDVTKDPRYLTTFGSTRSEIVVPVLHPANKSALGVIDVESERVDAFTEEDRFFLEECASTLADFWESGWGS